MGPPRIGDLLVEAGVITKAQLIEALRHQQSSGGRLGTNLVELGFVDEKTLASILSRQLSIPSATATQIDRIGRTVLELVPAVYAEKLRAIPVREDSGKLWVAMAEPTDQMAIDELQRITGRPVRPMVAPELLIQYALEKHYHAKRRPRIVEVRTGESDLLTIEGLNRTAPQQPPPSYDPYGKQSDAPVYEPISVQVDDLDSVTGFLDDASEVAKPVAPRMTIGELATQLVAANTDEAVFDVAMRYVGQDVAKLCVLLLRSGALCGWRGLGVDQMLLTPIKVPMDEIPLIAHALSSGQVYVGRIDPQLVGRLAQPLGLHGEVLGLIVPVRIGKRAVGAIVGIEASLEVMRRKPEINKLALKVDQALHISYLRRQLLAP